jgi:hypothetical protein
MADRPTVATLPTGGVVDIDTLNSNFTAIVEHFDTVLGLNGTSGSNNTMTGDVDWANKILRNATFDSPASTVSTLPDGSAGAPAFSFTNATTAGMYRDSVSGFLGFSVNSDISFAVIDGQGGNYLTASSRSSASPVLGCAGASSTIGIRFLGKGNTPNFTFENDNGETGFEVETVNNSVNFITARSAITNDQPLLFADGSDTNIDIKISPKGTGGVIIGSATGGGQGTDTLNCSGLYVDGVLVSSGGLPRSYLAGLGTSNGTDTDHDIDIAAGECFDNSTSESMVLSSAITKQIDAAWAVGTGTGGLDTGTVAANTWYYVWSIKRTDTGVVDALFSTSSSSPTMPTNYTVKRRIGAVLTNSSANILGFQQEGDEFLWDDPPLTLNGSGNSSGTNLTMDVPALTVTAIFNIMYAGDASYWSTPAVNNEAASITAAPLASQRGATTGNMATGPLKVRTNSSGQVRHREDGTSTLRVATLGWIDRRGRDD